MPYFFIILYYVYNKIAIQHNIIKYEFCIIGMYDYCDKLKWTHNLKNVHNICKQIGIINNINEYNQIMIKIFILACQLILSLFAYNKTLNMYAAIQNKHELYFSYLPYIDTCNYTMQGMYPGQLIVNPLSNSAFFQFIAYQDMTYYWKPVKNGLSIMALLQKQNSSSQGYILYDAELTNFNKYIIAYSINQTNLTFYYCLPKIDVEKMNLTLLIKQEVKINLNEASGQLLQNCPMVNNSNFVFLGNRTFMFVCGQFGLGFTFVPGLGTNSNHIIQFKDVGLGYYQVNPNGFILDDTITMPKNQWNCLLLNQNQTSNQLFFLTFNENYSNYTILTVEQMQPQIKLLISRIWGEQSRKQVSRWMDIFSNFNISENVHFPGNVVSVFASNNQNIFIQSATFDGINYLCVFDNKGTLYWNITYKGNIIYYGSDVTLIYDTQQRIINMLQVQRPIYTINVSTFGNQSVPDTFSKFDISLKCLDYTLNVQYNILWTTPDYPTALVICLNSTPIYSSDVVYGFKVPDKFLVIGPDFRFVVETANSIQVLIIDDSTIVINQQALQIVNFQVYNGNYFSAIIASNTTIYLANSKGQIQILSFQPCGFKSIQTIQKSGIFSYTVYANNGQKCQCTLDFSECHIVNQNQPKQIASNNQNSNSYSSPPNNIALHTQPFTTYQAKKNIFGLVNKGFYITITTNNQALLIQIKNGTILDKVEMFCLKQNITNGDIYTKQFFDPILVLYCEEASSVTQFVIRQNQIHFQREIPLYKFRTRTGMFTFYPAHSFIFIAVDPLVKVYPAPINCCVLRLNPCQYTVSVIQQIIEAQSIVAVTHYRNVDLVLLKSTSKANSQILIKAYFPDQWITLNQTNFTGIVSLNEPIQIVFQSPKYNFGASFNLSITFNLTNINLNVISQGNQQSAINDTYLGLDQVVSKQGRSMYWGKFYYNTSNYICGPLFNSLFFRSDGNMKNLQIMQRDVLTKSKILGNIGLQFIQIIDPAKWTVNSTLNYLILVVSVQRMFIYDKLLNNVQMAPIYNFTLPERKCKYYLYEIVNFTAATLISNCQSISYNMKSPFLTINYNPDVNNVFNYSYVFKILPLTLRQIYTIVRDDSSTLVIGILQGPMSSQTGRLYLCDGQECSPMYISTRFSFLLNYAAHYNSKMYLVVTIDVNTMQVFINPQVLENNTQILSNYSFNYTQYVEQPYCSVVKIINSTLQYTYITLSCSHYYYYMSLNFTSGLINIYNKFARYSQCDLYDQFKPSVIMNNGLQMLLAQCRQNDYTFRLQTYETINSSSVVIFTGYLQIFIITGPLGPNCQNDSISPVKIVPLSTSMNNPLFISYSVGANNSKFIYSQINGILIDNFVNFMPSLSVSYQPISLAQQQNFPSILVFITNQFHQILQKINTVQSISQKQKKPINIVVFALFLIANFVTIVFLVCFYIVKKDKSPQNQFLQGQYRQSMADNEVVELQYDDNLKKIYDNIIIGKQKEKQKEKQKQKQLLSPTRRPKNRPSQIQMFFIKGNIKPLSLHNSENK